MNREKVVAGDRVPIKIVVDDGSVELCIITWKCRWYFNDDKSRPRGFRVMHRFNKPGITTASYHITNKIDGSRMDGYTEIEVINNEEDD